MIMIMIVKPPHISGFEKSFMRYFGFRTNILPIVIALCRPKVINAPFS